MHINSIILTILSFLESEVKLCQQLVTQQATTTKDIKSYLLQSDEKLCHQLVIQQATTTEDIKSYLLQSDEKLCQQLISQQTTSKEDMKALANQIEELLKPPDNQCISTDAGQLFNYIQFRLLK